jgi:arylsulfatase
MLGTRGIWEEGWKAVAVHGPTSGIGHFDDDQWELFNVDEDRAEAIDLAEQHPDRLKTLIETWFAEAGKYDVLPLDDRKPWEILGDVRPQTEPDRDTYIYYADTAEVPEAAAPNIRGRSFKVLAEVEIESPDAEGVIFAHGGRFGGHALYLKDRRAHYVYNFLGVPPDQTFSSGELAPGRYVIGMEFAKDHVGDHGETIGTTRLHVDDEVVAEGTMRTQVGFFTLCGDGLCVGRDSSDPVTSEYSGPATFTGGTIFQVAIDVGDDQYIDLEQAAMAALARE